MRIKPELREKIIAFNRMAKENGEKASDMDTLIAKFIELPPGQLKKVLSNDMIVILGKYGVVLE